MGQPAAKRGDKIEAVDTHIVLIPGGAPPQSPLPHPFSGVLENGLSDTVRIMGNQAAMAGSSATNSNPHVPTPPGTNFATPPSNKGTIQTGSPTVRINGKPAARNGDQAMTCNDPVDQPVGTVFATGTVNIG
jgi:uncharacterized Zn-binding protein involved in type VI secretion